MTKELHVKAPAKINRFLHIVGQRKDGYHLLQTVFQLIDLHDDVYLTATPDGLVRRSSGAANVVPEKDLVVRAAKLLQEYTNTNQGCTIRVEKRIPMGAGLGGGSSDAAATLWGLNELWDLKLSRQVLMNLGVKLGADVPFFLFGQNAFAEGIGELLQAVSLPESSFLLIYPKVHIPTVDVFKDPNLTRNHPTVTISDFIDSPNLEQFGKNDCEEIVIQKYQEVAAVINWLRQQAPQSSPRMSGSGSSVFVALETDLANDLLSQLPHQWIGFVVRGLTRHPSYNPSS
jgi:4-diphosphocytidyl-2-C-methyl-D-erythritol kinase